MTNGTIRDAQTIRDTGFPVFSGGIALRGGTAQHPGWSGIPLAIAGVVVNPGDLVVGDVDGVLVVEAAGIEAVLDKTRSQHTKEMDAEARVRAGGSYRDVLAGYSAATANT